MKTAVRFSDFHMKFASGRDFLFPDCRQYIPAKEPKRRCRALVLSDLKIWHVEVTAEA